MNKYIIIDAEAIEKRIEELEKDIKFYTNEGKKLEANQCLGDADSLKQILSQSTPLIPQIEKAYEAGKLDKELSLSFDNPKGRYITNLKLDI